jgi:hypothetical protein
MNSARLVPAIPAAIAGKFPFASTKAGLPRRTVPARIRPRQAQRRECTFGHVESDSDDRRLSGQDKGWWEKRLWSVRSNGAPRRPVSFYRLSADCQPTIENWLRGPATRFIWSSAGPRRRYQPGENRRVPRNTLSVVPPQWSAVSADHSGLSMLSRGRGRAC